MTYVFRHAPRVEHIPQTAPIADIQNNTPVQQPRIKICCSQEWVPPISPEQRFRQKMGKDGIGSSSF